MTMWIHRAHIFVNKTIIESAKNKAESIMPDVDEQAMFSIQLSASGNTPPKAYGCNTALKLSHVQRWKDEFIDLNPIKITWFLLDATEKTLSATNSPDVIAGGQVWTWEDSVSNVGLQVIDKEEL